MSHSDSHSHDNHGGQASGGHGDSPGQGGGHGGGHGSIGAYLAVFVALCVLTSLSFITMHFFGDTPSIGWSIMMAVSCTKALLVIAFFMHLKWEASWKYVLTIPTGMMSIFLVSMLIPDVLLRTVTYTPERWLMAAEPAAAATEKPGGHDPKESEASGAAPGEKKK